MLAAVEAVTSTSQWQLALFNSWSHVEGGWWGEGWGGKADIRRPASYVTCTYVKYIRLHFGFQAAY